MKKIIKVDSISYTTSLIDKLKDFPTRSAFPCSVLENERVLGGLFLVCPPIDLKYFNIKPTEVPQPKLNFRMINFKEQFFIIEVWMAFGSHIEKILKIHLNPHDANVRELIRLFISTQMITFHFYNPETCIVVSAVTGLIKEELLWFERNFAATKNLTYSNLGFAKLTELLSDKVSKTDRLYKYLPTPDSTFFIKEGCSLSKLGEI